MRNGRKKQSVKAENEKEIDKVRYIKREREREVCERGRKKKRERNFTLCKT